MMITGDAELDGFIAKYTPEIAARLHACFAAMRRRLPGATVLAYDNYNALAIGFATSGSTSSVILSITGYPRWVSLFFMWGVRLDDPEQLLRGAGAQVRSLRLEGPNTLADPRVEALITQAVDNVEPPYNADGDGRIVIKSVVAKQRSRRPA